MQRYYADLPSVFLKPGEIFLKQDKTLVMTVLGSCIAISIYHHGLKFGGICHAVLPYLRHFGSMDNIFDCHDIQWNHPEITLENCKYVDGALLFMLRKFKQMSIPFSQLEIKAFGGGDVITAFSPDRISIGKQNIRVLQQYLKALNLTLMSSDLGNKFGRKVFFVSYTGEVFLKKVKRLGDRSGQGSDL